MKTLKYTIIKDAKQYKTYCDTLEKLIFEDNETSKDEAELLTLLIEKWDNEHTTFQDTDPIQLLNALLEQNNLKAKDLGEILSLSKGTVSKVLNYHKGLSKETIRKLAAHFKISQEAFNRTYSLRNDPRLVNNQGSLVEA
jgi:HTH-type transcriptional regulator/antitoxin HigA